MCGDILLCKKQTPLCNIDTIKSDSTDSKSFSLQLKKAVSRKVSFEYICQRFVSFNKSYWHCSVTDAVESDFADSAEYFVMASILWKGYSFSKKYTYRETLQDFDNSG